METSPNTLREKHRNDKQFDMVKSEKLFVKVTFFAGGWLWG